MNSKIFKTTLLLVFCGTITAFAVEVPINGKFAKDDKGQLLYWKPQYPRKTVSIEVIPASDGKSNAMFVENDNKSFAIGHYSLKKVTSYKKLHFSIHAKGNGGFAVQLNCYTDKSKYIGTLIFLQGKASPDAFQEFKGSLDVPETLKDQKVVYITFQILVFKNAQIIFENAALTADEH